MYYHTRGSHRMLSFRESLRAKGWIVALFRGTCAACSESFGQGMMIFAPHLPWHNNPRGGVHLAECCASNRPGIEVQQSAS